LCSSFSCHAPPLPETYTLSLHDALPIFHVQQLDAAAAVIVNADIALAFQGAQVVRGGILRLEAHQFGDFRAGRGHAGVLHMPAEDRKSTRLNSSHVKISYAVFCLKKKKE